MKKTPENPGFFASFVSEDRCSIQLSYGRKQLVFLLSIDRGERRLVSSYHPVRRGQGVLGRPVETA
jgi:hypothetical protein